MQAPAGDEKAVCAGLVPQLEDVMARGEPEKAWKISENLKPPKTARSQALFEQSPADGQIPDAGNHDVLGLVAGGDGALDGVVPYGTFHLPENAAGMA